MADSFEEFQRKYLEAVEKEQLNRDASFVCNFDVIGNIKVYSLTPRLLSILTLMKSPFVVGGEITNEAILVFLWVIKEKSANEDSKDFFNTVIKTEDVNKILTEIDDYFSLAIQDNMGGTDADSTTPYWSNMASIVDHLASEYGWKEEDIINIPYKRLFQYMRVIAKRHNPEKVMFNKSDHIKSEYANKLNQGLI